MKRIILLVIDGFGVGQTPDADKYGDIGANTFGNIDSIKKMNIPNLESLGLRELAKRGSGVSQGDFRNAVFARIMPKSKGKDTLTGHLEIAGVVSRRPYPVFLNKAIPEKVVRRLEGKTGHEFIGLTAESGIKIIDRLGEEHLKDKGLILYTSADSVLQVAAHSEVVDTKELYKVCQIIRENSKVGRVIARPFSGIPGKFYRLNDARSDYPLEIKRKTLLDKIYDKGIEVISVGKIFDIFNGRSISRRLPGKNNEQAFDSVIHEIKNKNKKSFIFVNLVDTDMIYGHRNDVLGYKNSIEQTDSKIGEILDNLDTDDLLIITADHGCDPTMVNSTDHTREYLPLLIYNKELTSKNLGTVKGLDFVSKVVLEYFGFRKMKLFNNIGENHDKKSK